MISRELLEAMTRAIVEAAEPAMVVVFGSAARGEAREGSDVDLLVVEPGSVAGRRRAIAARIRRALRRFPVAKDVLVVGEDELDAWRETTNHVIARALREGRVLYARS